MTWVDVVAGGSVAITGSEIVRRARARRRAKRPVPCEAVAWAHGDEPNVVIVYGVCDRPKGHANMHVEERDGEVWAEWSGNSGPIDPGARGIDSSTLRP